MGEREGASLGFVEGFIEGSDVGLLDGPFIGSRDGCDKGFLLG